jgi:hypothetical protein
VTLRRAALGLAVVVALATAGAGAATGSDTPYTKRLQILEALAVRYPGAVQHGTPLGKYGLWSGIVVQTAWQQRSHRDRIGLWSMMNLHLSVEPSTYAARLERPGAPGDARSLCMSATAVAVCEDWARYFLAARQGLPPSTLLRLLWRAHTTAIATNLRAQRAAFARVRTTQPERNFWSSWVQIVFLLEAAHFPTNATTSVRASKLLMPPCSPLGAPGCRLTAHDLGRTFPFVSALATRPASIDRDLKEYETLRTNPLALAALVASDPALTRAIGLYLAVAR